MENGKLTHTEITAFEKDLNASLLEVCKKHHIDIDIPTLHITNARQIMTLRLRMSTQAYDRRRKADPYFKQRGETSAQMRFRLHGPRIYPELPGDALGKTYNVNGTHMRFLGLYGRQHKIVLQRLATGELLRIDGKEALPHLTPPSRLN